MIIYFVNVLLIVIASYICYIIMRSFTNQSKKKRVQHFFIFLVTVQLIVILALRHRSIGLDIETYLVYFRSVNNTSLDTLLEHRYEEGYIFLNTLIGAISSDSQVFIAIIACITVIPLGIFIAQYSRYPFLSFIVYICFNYYSFIFSGFRQGIAYAIVMMSYRFIRERKLFAFICMVLFASLFHKSSYIFIFAYFIANVKLTKPVIVGLVGLNGILFLFRRVIFSWVSEAFYSDYSLVESSSYSWMLYCTFILFICFFAYKKALDNSQHNCGLYNLVLFGCSLMMFASVGNNVMRIVDFYYMFIIILIPEALYTLEAFKSRVLAQYGAVIMLLIVYVWLLGQDGFGIVPYRLFWM